MNFRRSLLASCLALVLATGAVAGVGDALPETDFEDFTATPAKTIDDFLGRTVLIEFFAHW